MPNPSELQRQLEENEAEIKKYIPKGDKERILRRIRELERQLGVTPRNYNSEKF